MDFEANEKKKAADKGFNARVIYIALIVIGALLIAFSAYNLISAQIAYSSARTEYEDLREIFNAFIIEPAIPQETDDNESSPQTRRIVGVARPRTDDYETPADPMETLLEINPDFIAWIRIDGIIDYPVVAGRNNSRYLSTTFQGTHNSSGAIFLDYRNNVSLGDQVSIIYGHNMRDGSMFSPLHSLRDPDILEAHRYITVVTSDWRIITYRIFAARLVNTLESENDPTQMTAAALTRAVRGAPEGTQRILILSTCTTSADDYERLRIYAAEINYIPAG